MTSSPWAGESAPEANVSRQNAELASEPELEEEDEDGGDMEKMQSSTSCQVDGERPVGCRKKKTRTVFSRTQVLQLESTFDAKRYLSSAERSSLATALRLTETQV